jgi:hypothetical protein
LGSRRDTPQPKRLVKIVIVYKKASRTRNYPWGDDNELPVRGVDDRCPGCAYDKDVRPPEFRLGARISNR